jgi:hypothetical protein
MMILQPNCQFVIELVFEPLALTTNLQRSWAEGYCPGGLSVWSILVYE